MKSTASVVVRAPRAARPRAPAGARRRSASRSPCSPSRPPPSCCRSAVVFSWTRLRGPEARRAFVWLGVWSALFAAYAVVEMLAFTKRRLGRRADPSGSLRAAAHVGGVRRALLRDGDELARRVGLPRAARRRSRRWIPGGSRRPRGARQPRRAHARRRCARAARRPRTGSGRRARSCRSHSSGRFRFPLADRYLYPILPGLIGGFLLAAQDLTARLGLPARRLAPVALALGLGVLSLFAARSHARARIWAVPALLAADSAAHYPDGVNANLLRASRAAQEGDRDAALSALRAAAARGYERFDQLLANPIYASAPGRPGLRRADRRHGGALDHTARCAPRSGAVGAAFPRDRTPSARRAGGGAPGGAARPRPGRSAARGARAGAPAPRRRLSRTGRRRGAQRARAGAVFAPVYRGHVDPERHRRRSCNRRHAGRSGGFREIAGWVRGGHEMDPGRRPRSGSFGSGSAWRGAAREQRRRSAHPGGRRREGRRRKVPRQREPRGGPGRSGTPLRRHRRRSRWRQPPYAARRLAAPLLPVAFPGRRCVCPGGPDGPDLGTQPLARERQSGPARDGESRPWAEGAAGSPDPAPRRRRRRPRSRRGQRVQRPRLLPAGPTGPRRRDARAHGDRERGALPPGRLLSLAA